MPGTSCCVENCHSRSCDPQGNKTGIRFFRFPHWKRSYGEQVAEVTKRRRMAWVAAVRRKDITFDRISQWMRVCSRHFHSGEPSYEMLENHPDWKPSLLLGHNDVHETDQARYQRHLKRKAMADRATVEGRGKRQRPPLQDAEQEQEQEQEQEEVPEHLPLKQEEPASPEVKIEYEEVPLHEELLHPTPLSYEELPLHQDAVQPPQSPRQNVEQPPPHQHTDQPRTNVAECALCKSRQDLINCLLEENRQLKKELEEYRMNEGFLKGDDERVKYYTGLPNFDLFQVFLLNVLPFLRQGKKKLTPFQYILLTLMRLRLDLPIQHLGHLFRVHRTTVGVAFQETVTVLHTLFSPDKDSLLASMPRSFVETLKAKCQKALSDGETVTGKNSAASKDSATVKDGVAINCSGIGKNSVAAKDSVTTNDRGSTIDSVT